MKSELKSAKSTVFGRRVPKEWDFIFYQLYRFQKMPKEYALYLMISVERVFGKQPTVKALFPSVDLLDFGTSKGGLKSKMTNI